MGAWMLIVGVAAVILGAVVMGLGYVGALVDAFGDYWLQLDLGALALIFTGGAVALAGLVVIAIRR
jgi:hypothetical protein